MQKKFRMTAPKLTYIDVSCCQKDRENSVGEGADIGVTAAVLANVMSVGRVPSSALLCSDRVE